MSNKTGEAPAAKVAKKADMPRTTAISILEKLYAENFLSMHRYKGVTYYWIESPHTFRESMMTKLRVAEELGKSLGDLYRSEAHFPSAEVFDTKSGIRKFIEKFLGSLERKSILYTIDTPHEGNYAKIYSSKIENIIVSQKKKKDIVTYTLVPAGSFRIIEPHKIKNQNIVIRELPMGIDFQGSLWLGKNTLVHFSGTPPVFSSAQARTNCQRHENSFRFFVGHFFSTVATKNSKFSE